MLRTIQYKNASEIVYDQPLPYGGVVKIAGKIGLGVVKTVITSIIRRGRDNEIAGRILSDVYSVLWSNRKGYWNEMIEAVETLIQQDISENIKNNALAALTDIRNALRLYQQAVEDWESNRTDSQLQERVRNQLISTITFIEFAMPSFTVQHYEVILLPIFAQVANLHLLLLRDVEIFGLKWRMSKAEIDDYYFAKSGLTRLTQKYTNHSVKWYREGLCIATNIDLDQCPEFYQLDKWNAMNDFRREMTFMVLDIIALWPTYDPIRYPLGIKTELTREVFTPLLGINPNSSCLIRTMEEIEAKLTVLSPFLSWISFEQLVKQGDGISTFTDWGNFTLSNTMLPLSYILGGAGPGTGDSTNIPMQSENYDVYKVLVGTDYSHPSNVPIRKLEYYCTNGMMENVITVGTGTTNALFELPNNGCVDYSHRVSRLSCSNVEVYEWEGGPKYALKNIAYGWTHISVDSKNTLSHNAITQIPARKGYSSSESNLSIEGPYFTGGDLIVLPPNGAQLQMRVSPPVSSSSINYCVRLRYASSGNTDIYVERVLSSGDTYGETHDVPATYSGGSLSYSSFAYVVNLTAIFEGFNVEIKIKNIGSSQIILDKIEFLPIKESLKE
ncbi:hypothetical protein COF80_04260 [Bacillus toyonensis]|uniref:insecticidal delta-endotoxin Cry8Ea1 family protein n=1 Tax=Bacillus toyonensis TaxID=155322 RepID=UPI000BF1225D|nr:insecticidal delta-endotoxin Cry8Ea1 family protein [Bacillus toyonensis]PEM47152.1 hypothetical protein CN636_04775 [Bacillus toyonensis]PHE88776.1 hypothetical protein COF80_04260 [Bacillus toyonensis]